MENKIYKSGQAQGVPAVTDEDMAAINRFAMEPLTAENVFVFRVNLCDNQIDRDHERFSDAALEKLAELFQGKTVIADHQWSAANQCARIFETKIAADGDVKRLQARCYMLRCDETRTKIDAIRGGILREVSIGCGMARSLCSICGNDYYGRDCGHQKGERYDGKDCYVILDDPQDAYEASFVAVPAQREAGVTKAAGACAAESDREKQQRLQQQATALLDVEYQFLNN